MNNLGKTNCSSQAVLKFVYQGLSQDCFQGSLKLFKLSNIFLRFVFKTLSLVQILCSPLTVIFSPHCCSQCLSSFWPAVRRFFLGFLFQLSCELIQIEANPSNYHFIRPDQIFWRQWRVIFQMWESEGGACVWWEISWETVGKVATRLLIKK